MPAWLKEIVRRDNLLRRRRWPDYQSVLSCKFDDDGFYKAPAFASPCWTVLNVAGDASRATRGEKKTKKDAAYCAKSDFYPSEFTVSLAFQMNGGGSVREWARGNSQLTLLLCSGSN